jgi:glycerate kinase
MKVRPHDDLVLLPMADGGEGTLEAFRRGRPGAVLREVQVEGPDNRPVTAPWLSLDDGTAVLEVASTSGITLMNSLRPLDAHTYGLGQAIANAIDNGAKRIIIGLGGSSSTDGGTGALTALGARLGDSDGRELARGGGALNALSTLDLAGLRPLPPEGVLLLTDVTNPLLGPSGAAQVFGPQKGAGSSDIEFLERGLRKLATLLPSRSHDNGAGAAGGTAFGLAAWGATISEGAPVVGHEIGLPHHAADADILITGEGRYDSQSAAGKLPWYVHEVAKMAGARCFLVAGSIATTSNEFDACASLTVLAGTSKAAMNDPLIFLEIAGRELAMRNVEGCPTGR